VGVHKGPETSSGHVTPERGPTDQLHRRHTAYCRVQGPGSGSGSSLGVPTGMSRLHHQHRVQSFAKGKSKPNILLRIDNTTAVAYINHLGGTISRELVNLTKTLWMWFLERNIHITAQHLPGTQNTIVDAESRAQIGKTDWKLSPLIFPRIQETFGPSSGPDCNSSVCPVPSLLQLAARSVSRSDRCVPPSVDSHQGVCQSFMELNRQDTGSSTNSTSQHSAGSTSVEVSTMVPHAPTLVG